MKVILKRDVDNLGDAGEVVDVADGYGNNYLMPRGLAMRATKGAVKDAEAMVRARKVRAAASVAEATERKEALEATTVVVTAKADEDGHLYGSVGANALLQAAHEQLGLKIEKRQLGLDRPLKTVGEHDVDVRLHRDVTATLRVEVAPVD
jgi:large subunit ribosomal protein L9